MKTLTAIIYPGETKRWLVAFNPETGTTTQGKTVEEALKNLKEATALFLEEQDLPDRTGRGKENQGTARKLADNKTAIKKYRRQSITNYTL